MVFSSSYNTGRLVLLCVLSSHGFLFFLQHWPLSSVSSVVMVFSSSYNTGRLVLLCVLNGHGFSPCLLTTLAAELCYVFSIAMVFSSSYNTKVFSSYTTGRLVLLRVLNSHGFLFFLQHEGFLLLHHWPVSSVMCSQY